MSLPSSNPASIIGAGGGDYTTIASWEADLDDAQLDANYTAYLRDLAGDNVGIFFSGVNSTASYKAILQAESGYEADGSDAAGAQIDVNLDIYEDSNQWNMDIIGIEFHTAGGITVSADGSADDVINITKCVFRDTGDAVLVNNNNTAITVNVGVCLMRNLSGEAVQLSDANPSVKVLNCTVYDTNYALYDGANAFAQVKNCVSMDNDQDDYTADNQSYNCASDTSAAGTGSIDSASSADNFTNAGGDDFTVKDTNADIYHAGNAIAGEGWFPATDLAGVTWNNPPSMGCFEYDAGGDSSSGGGEIISLIANIQGSSVTPDDISTTMARALIADIQGASTTSEISATIARALIASITGTSTTPSISATIARALLANIQGASTTPEIIATLTRSVIANIQGSSVTPDDITATLQNIISLIASIAGISTTPSITIEIARSLSASITGSSVTPDDLSVTIARALMADIAGTSVTPTNLTLILAILSILNPTMTSITPARTMTSATAARTMTSATPVRTIHAA